MKHIGEYVEEIDEELCDAKNYAEKAIYWKYEGNANRYKQYYSMSEQELSHANIIHQMAVEDINKMRDQGFTAPEEMEEIWRQSHAEYVEKTAWIKKMLEM